MPKRLPQYVYREVSRHGRAAFYFRKGKGKRVRLPPYGSEGFDEAYLAALREVVPSPRRQAAYGTLAWLIEQYRASADYQNGYAAATRRQRDNIFKGVIAKGGSVAFKRITPAVIKQGAADRKGTPAQARNFLDAMRGLFAWAETAGHVKESPAAGIKNPKRIRGDGFAVWTDDDVAAFEKRWEIGTRERVWLTVLLYTGLRRGDAARVGKQHVRDGMITIQAEKTRTRSAVMVYIPYFDELAAIVERGPTGDLAFIAGKRGEPLTKESFGNMFRVACDAAGVSKSAHGLRKLAATRAAEKGLTVAELESMFGWSGGTMASFYTKAADRRRLARLAGEKMGNVKSPHPEMQRPAPKKNLK